MSNASKNTNNDQSNSNASSSTNGQKSGSFAGPTGETFGGLANPTSNPEADRAADEAAQQAARDSFAHANEFSGLGPTGAPASREHANEFSSLGPSGGSPTGNDSLNSHRGYGPDNSLAGGIDRDVNAGLETQTDQENAVKNTDARDLVGPAGNGAAGLQGGIEAYRDHVDRGARRSAAGTLTKGSGGNLPAPGYANRTGLGRTITDPRMTANRALDATPFGPNARSTQQLAAGAKAASNVGRFANGVGLGIQPAAGAIQGFVNTPENASWTERATNTVIGAAKEIDDTGLSYGAGLGAGSLTVAGSVFTGPAAPAVAASAPAVGVAAAVGTGAAYNNSSVDNFFDGVVEDYGRPAVQGFFDAVDWGIDGVTGLYGSAFGDEDAGK